MPPDLSGSPPTRDAPGVDAEPPGPHHAPPSLAPLTVERLLGRVRKPGRYAGGEWNSVVKDWSQIALKWCLAYPDLYEIGMSNLGLRILYEVLNDRPDRLAERCFAPDADLRLELRRAAGATTSVGPPSRDVSLWSLETRRSLREFDVLGLSLGYELVAANILEMLHLAGIGLTSGERRPSDPLVIAGGSIVPNPEPFAEFVDAVVLGEGEDVVLEIGNVLESIGWHRRESGPDGGRRGVDRATALLALARIPGVYVPSLYRPQYLADGRFDGLERLNDAAPERVNSRIAADFETTVRGIRQLVPNMAIVFDRAQIEVMRGCTRGCRFCQAGMQSRPLRERAPDVAVAAAEQILDATGYEEIGLTSLSTADYTYIREVGTELHRRRPDITLSLPSTRVDAFTVQLVDAISQTGRKGGFTFAPEAGTQRMRDTINKGVSDEEIARTAGLAFERGWSSVKLYFMIGLPGETMEDVLGIAAISQRVLDMGRRRHGGRAAVKAAISTFIPKVMTPFQWDGQDTTEEIDAKVGALRKAMHGKGLTMTWHDPQSSILEAALGRGDRRLGAVIKRAWETGAGLDAWDEHFDFSIWLAAFAAEGLDPAWYAQRDIPMGESLPWEHLAGGVSMDFLRRDRARAAAARTTPDCHWGPCSNCGAPAATGFACDAGTDGPRRLLVSIGDEGRVWRYPGAPGDPSRAVRVEAPSDTSGNVEGRHADPRGWPYDLLGTEMQSKDAGLRGLASLVEAAGGESTG